MNLDLHLALSYLKGRGKFPIHASNMLSLGGIILSVFSLLIVSSVMNGFDKDIMDRIIGTKAEVKLSARKNKPITNYETLLKQLDQNPLIKASSPVIENQLMILNGKNMQGCVLYGVDLDRHRKVTGIFDPIPENAGKRQDEVLRGIVIGVADQQFLDRDGIILGMDLAMQLQVSIGDTIQVASPTHTIPTPLGMIPVSRNLVVIATFVSGMPEYDRMFGYISLVNGLFFSAREKGVDYIQVRTADQNSIQTAAQKLSLDYPGYSVQDWSHFDPNLFSAMKMEKIVMISVLCLMLLITSFNMTGNLLKLTVLKRKEIGILKALGTKNTNIRNIFLLQGVILTVSGIVIGVLAALILLKLQIVYHFVKIPMGTLPLLNLPVEIKTMDFLIIPLISLVISFFSALYPALKNEKLNPIETIRS